MTGMTVQPYKGRAALCDYGHAQRCGSACPNLARYHMTNGTGPARTYCKVCMCKIVRSMVHGKDVPAGAVRTIVPRGSGDHKVGEVSLDQYQGGRDRLVAPFNSVGVPSQVITCNRQHASGCPSPRRFEPSHSGSVAVHPWRGGGNEGARR